MAEPATEAGQGLLAETSQSALAKVKGWYFTLEGMAVRIAAIEREAVAADRAKLAEQVRALREPEGNYGLASAGLAAYNRGINAALKVIERHPLYNSVSDADTTHTAVTEARPTRET